MSAETALHVKKPYRPKPMQWNTNLTSMTGVRDLAASRWILFLIIFSLILLTNCGKGDIAGTGTDFGDMKVSLKMAGSSIPIITTDMAYNPEQDAFYLYYSTCTSSGKLVRYDRNFTSKTDLLSSGQIFWDPTACMNVDIASRGSKIYLFQDLYLAVLTIGDNGNVSVDEVTQLTGWSGILTRILGRYANPIGFQADDRGNIYFTDTQPYPDSYALFRYTPTTKTLTSLMEDGVIESQTGLEHSYFVLLQLDSGGYEGFDLASGLYVEIAEDGRSIDRYIGFFPQSFISAGGRIGDTRIFFNDWRLNIDDLSSIERENLGGGFERFTIECETFVSTTGNMDQFIISHGGRTSVVAADGFLPQLTEGGPDARRMIQTGSSVVLFDYYNGQIWEISP